MSLSVRRLIPALLLALIVPASLQAAVFIPNKTADTNDGVCDSDCSLREAITAANQNPGEHVILLHAGTYTLTASGPATGNLQIQGDVLLMGDGAGSTIVDGGGLGGIFYVSSGATVQIQDVTLRNGRSPGAGGAIHNQGDLTLLRTILTGNSSVAGTAGSGQGGAIVSDGANSSLTIADSTIANNTAQRAGGGILAGGNVSLTNVTVAGNRSTGGFGGGLYLFSSVRAVMSNVTIAGNSAALKGGGLFVETTAFIGLAPKVTSSILAANTASSEPDCSGSLDSSYDLIGNSAGCFGPAGSHNKAGTAASPLDPRLGSLAANGGPTPTLALLAGSPAINAGNPAPAGSGAGACSPTDQRGVRRNATCDVGAFETTTACVAGGSTLCLDNGRFKVTANWQTSTAGGAANAVTLDGDNGYFWFLDPGSVEVVAKILDNCAANGHYWYFLGGLTNARVDLTITDTRTGKVATYTSPSGQAFRTLINRVTFACP